ncbi:AAA family ATPase [Desulfosarcina sp. OttesenSCG-928-A07]|nr:AAA family ATPase [Desulfosarcina sp. OttesenSCG-928-G17]MDL2329595.1 AAA family ATPase [Desulfosarcina sp. OttesenSCG-928-A07]
MSHPHLPFLRRIRVVKTLHETVSTYPLTVLHAPTGYGKTTAVRDMLTAFPKNHFFTFLHHGEKTAANIWDSLTGQLEKAGETSATQWRRAGFPQDSREIHWMLDHIVDAFADRQILWVIDDYHYARSSEFDYFIERLVKVKIKDLSLLLISRTRPGAFLEELNLLGVLAELNRDLLIFSYADVKKYFQLAGITDEAAVWRAHESCEGWGAALCLMAQGYFKYDAPVAGHTIDRLVENALYKHYSKEDQSLLLQLSICDYFTPELATAISGRFDAPRRLQFLYDHNTLLSYDPVTNQYRLHSLLRSFLLRLLRADNKIDSVQVYRKAARWFLADNDLLRAVHFFANAGQGQDYLNILRIFLNPKSGRLLQFDLEGLSDIFERIPWKIRIQCPMGYLYFVYACLAFSGSAQAIQWVFEAEERFMASPEIPEIERYRIKGEILLIKSLTAFNDIQTMLNMYEQAYAILKGRSSIFHRHLNWTFGCPHISFLYLRQPGTYLAILDKAHGFSKLFQDLADGCSAGADILVKAEYLLETGSNKDISMLLEKSLYLANDKEQLATLLSTHFIRARKLLGMGDQHGAFALLKSLEPQIRPLAINVLDITLDLALGYICGCMGDVQHIPEWLRHGDIRENRAISGTGVHLYCPRQDPVGRATLPTA